MKVELQGLDSLVKKINTLGGNAGKALEKGLMKAGELIEGDAKDLCIPDTGRLRNSIHTKLGGTKDSYTYKDDKGNEYDGSLSGVGEKYTVSIGTNVEYAAYEEYGTGQRGAASPSPPKAPIKNGYTEDWKGRPAKPFLYPALIQNKENVREICIEELNKEIRKLGGR